MFIKVEHGIDNGNLWVRGTVEPADVGVLDQLDAMQIVGEHFGSAAGGIDKEQSHVFIIVTLKTIPRKWSRKDYHEIAHGILGVLQKAAKKR